MKEGEGGHGGRKVGRGEKGLRGGEGERKTVKGEERQKVRNMKDKAKQ